MEETNNRLVKSSLDVIKRCSQKNGSIIAADVSAPCYPINAKSYNFVWPRDGAYACIAGDMYGLDTIQEPFFEWVDKCAEGFAESNLLYEKYGINGVRHGTRIQLDQNALVIMAIADFYNNHPDKEPKYLPLIIKLATGICDLWQNNHFKLNTNDLWEERFTFPDIEDNFTYSLAACVKALRVANQIFPDHYFSKTSEAMNDILVRSPEKLNRFYRSFGKLDDDRVDASLLGLIWPFEIIGPEHQYAQNTINALIDNLVIDFGMHRYENDDYDGWKDGDKHRNKGSGYWPLLNFWLSIVLSKANRVEDSDRYFQKVIADLEKENTYNIAEQIFSNDIQKSVCPLCWSHAMFLIANKLINKEKENHE